MDRELIAPRSRADLRRGFFGDKELMVFALEYIGFQGEFNTDNFRRHVIEGLNESQRALIVCKFYELINQRKKDVKAECKAWIQNARSEFFPGRKRKCQVCGGYKELAQPHHIYPLAVQFWDGLQDPVQDFVWLCPTHHSMVHFVIDKVMKSKPISMPEFLPGELSCVDRIATKFVRLRYGNGVL